MDNLSWYDDLEQVPITEEILSDAEVEAIVSELTKEGAAETKEQRTAREMNLLTSFKSKPSPETFAPLYQSYKPLIMKATHKNMYGSMIPEAAHTALAAQNFYTAVKTWQPSKGSFQTWAYNTVQNKGKRLNLKYQNVGYIPEGRSTKYQNYTTTLHLMREELGREPSAHEVADEMSIPVAEVERFQKEVRKTYLQDEHVHLRGPAYAQSDKTIQAAHDIMHYLIPSHQVVLEYALGLNGKPELTRSSGGGRVADIPLIAKTTGMTTSSVRSAFKAITSRIKEYRKTGPATDLEEIFGGELNG